MKTISKENKSDIERLLPTFVCPKDTVEGTRMMFNVKRNLMGELFIAMLRKALNRSSYTMIVKGSCADRKGKRAQGYTNVVDQGVPLEHADRFRVYIDRKNVVSETDWRESWMQKLNDRINELMEENENLRESYRVQEQDDVYQRQRSEYIEQLENDNRTLEIKLTLSERKQSNAYDDYVSMEEANERLQKKNADLEHKLNRLKLSLEAIGYSI